MSEYIYRKRMPSLMVSKELLLNIETYLVNQFQLPESKDDCSVSTQTVAISIEEEYGKESFASAKDIPSSFLPETIKGVSFYFMHSVRDKKLSIWVTLDFEKESDFCKLRIEVSEPSSARSIAEGIAQRINAKLGDAKTLHWIFYLPFWLSMILALILIIVGMICVEIKEEVDFPFADSLGILLILTVFLYVPITRQCFPYIIYNTRRWQIIAKTRNYIFALLVFPILLAPIFYYRDKLGEIFSSVFH